MSRPLFLQLGCSPMHRECLSITETAHKEYCKQHDYEYRIVENLPEPISWKKLSYLLNLMQPNGPQEIYFLDADAMVVDPLFDMRDILPEDAWLGCVISPVPWEYENWHIQFGVSYWRNCVKAKEFLNRVLMHQYSPDPYYGLEQGAINKLLLEERHWQSGFCALPSRFNSGGGHFHPREDAVVAGFHAKKDRPEVMRTFVRRQNLLPKLASYLKGNGVDFGCGMLPIPGAYCLVDINPGITDFYNKHLPFSKDQWPPHGEGKLFEVNVRDINAGFEDWILSNRKFNFIYCGKMLQSIENVERFAHICSEILHSEGALILEENFETVDERTRRFVETVGGLLSQEIVEDSLRVFRN
jgi:hypothetical protein